MATDFKRDNPADSTYQLPDCESRNSRLKDLVLTVWYHHCIKQIDRVDQAPDTYGWEVTY
jgi:hypothetical protein